MPERCAPFATALALGLLTLAGPGCAGRTEVKIDAVQAAATMSPAITTAVYTSPDSNTADVYLSDLPAAAFADPGGLTGATGSIIHIHLFIYPESGRIPVGQTACNATVQHVILAGVGGGVYGGGGFILPDSPPGHSRFSGSIREVTLQPLRAGPAFADRLGASKLTGRFAAVRDETTSRAIAARLDAVIAATPPIPGIASPGENAAAPQSKAP